MDSRVKIKIIKKSDVKTEEAPEPGEKKSASDEVSEMTSTVSGWVSDFQQNRRLEIETAIERFNA
jgi:hypothetical protein